MKVVLPSEKKEVLLVSELFISETNYNAGLKKFVVLTKGEDCYQVVASETDNCQDVFAFVENGIRVHHIEWMTGVDLYCNIIAKIKEGWEVNSLDTLPELFGFFAEWVNV